MTLEGMVACIEAMQGEAQIRAANALLWRWPGGLEIAEALALSGPRAVRSAMDAHLAWLGARAARETQAERTARQMLNVAGVVTAIDGLLGPLPARLARVAQAIGVGASGLVEAIKRTQRDLACGAAEASIVVLGSAIEASQEAAETPAGR